MYYEPLTREEMIRVIEGKGRAHRIPLLFHNWINADAFGPDKRDHVAHILASYPQDAQTIVLRMPDVYHAPYDDPSYRWSYRDARRVGAALDNSGVIEDWDEELDLLLNDFPSPDYPGLIPDAPPRDGRYRMGHWFFFFFERFWSLRSMEDALTDFYLYPEAVHALFQKMADFYIRAITRAKEELDIDAIFTSDDLGTQTSTFFSLDIFDTFFAPYYRQVIDRIHELGMHFWLHTCGNVETFIPRYVDLGVDVLHPIQKYTMDEGHIAQTYGDKLCIWSGFDVQRIIPYGAPEDVRREVRFLIDTYDRPDGRFMLTLGNGATPDTPVESLRALFDESTHYRDHVYTKDQFSIL